MLVPNPGEGWTGQSSSEAVLTSWPWQCSEVPYSILAVNTGFCSLIQANLPVALCQLFRRGRVSSEFVMEEKKRQSTVPKVLKGRWEMLRAQWLSQEGLRAVHRIPLSLYFRPPGEERHLTFPALKPRLKEAKRHASAGHGTAAPAGEAGAGLVWFPSRYLS